MKKIIGFIFAILAIIFFIFRSDTDSEIVQSTTEQRTIEFQENNTLINNQVISKNPNASLNAPHSSKKKLLSSNAIKYLSQTSTEGWDFMLQEFESKAIYAKGLTETEIQYFCDLALVNLKFDEFNRLLNTSCKPGAKVSNLLISPISMNQDLIINKLKILQNRGDLLLSRSYNNKLEETVQGKITISLYDRAVAYGFNNVIEYLESIGAQPTQNPLYTQVTNKPSIETLNFLLKKGYSTDQMTLDFIENNNFAVSHPDVYNLLRN